MKLISIGTEYDTEEDGVRAHIIETMGEDFWHRLAGGLGGKDVRIPMHAATLNETHPLVLALGMDDAASLVREVPGERLYVRRPPADPAQTYLAAMREGLSNREIADRFGISDRAVRRALARIGVRNTNISPAAARARSESRLDEDEFQRRAKVYLRFRKGELTSLQIAAQRLGMTDAGFRGFIKSYRARLEDYVAARAHASPTVSNAGLTGLASVSAPFTLPTTETRVSGP